jgi:hypothetical protein
MADIQETHCPICFAELESRELAPCDDCGGDPEELIHFREGSHRYAVFAVFPGLELTLCDFCFVDFGSYNPEFFGLPKQSRIGFEKLNFVRCVDQPAVQQGKVCTQCGLRLTFARFVALARERHQQPE